MWMSFGEECAEQKAGLGKGPDVEECLTCLRVSAEAWAAGLACSGEAEGDQSLMNWALKRMGTSVDSSLEKFSCKENQRVK